MQARLFRGRRSFRKGSHFVLDPIKRSTKMDRNQRAKLLLEAERLERTTKAHGKKNGALGYTGLKVLRALLLTFQSRATGLCCPSYFSIQAATGLSRQAISDALGRLERAGIIQIIRRIKREVIERRNPRTGQLERIETTIQTSNLYRFVSSFSGLLVKSFGTRGFIPLKVASFFTAKPLGCPSQQLTMNLNLFGVTPQAVESVKSLRDAPLPSVNRPLKFGLIDLS